jgi:hypothetical protein
LAKIQQKSRFSLRDQDNYVIRSSINTHLGIGKTYWSGDVLPEENSRSPFLFKALSGFPEEESTRFLGAGYLEIQKPSVGNVKGVYEGGGLYSPWSGGYPLIASVSLKMSVSDVTFDGLGFCGVVIGLKADGKGVAVKFYSGGVVQLHDAAFLTTSPPSPSYVASYDWDQGKVHTYYLLWHQELDRVRLYASSSPDTDVPDTLLVDGKISDLPSLPEEEVPAVEPSLYFGHGYPATTSISRWYSANLYNEVSTPIINGVFVGGHTGFLESDEAVEHTSSSSFLESRHSWMKIPGSEGVEIVYQNNTVEMVSNGQNSFGFYRREPKVLGQAILIDVEMSGYVRSKEDSGSSGMEFFVDDGTKKVVFGLVYSSGSQAIGIQNGANPKSETNYSQYVTGWETLRNYRILIDPASNVRVISLDNSDGSYYERDLISAPYSSMQSSEIEKSLGVRHNLAACAASASLFLGRIRYSTQLEYWESTSLPASPWTQDGSGGTVSLLSTSGMRIEDLSTTDHLYFKKSMPSFTSGYGFMVEFLSQIESYGFGGEVSPVRENTGIIARVQDGTYQCTLVFADGGPSVGKIVYIATDDDYEANLWSIRAGLPSVDGTYAVVDWTRSHLYRLEKKIGKGLSLWIDNSKKTSIHIPESQVSLPLAIGAFSGIEFGSVSDDHTSSSVWYLLRNSVSSGYDGEVFPNLTEEEILNRFDSSLICLVEAESP